MINKSLLVALLIILLTPIAVYAWNDCPYGIIDDPYPGQCARYVDTNNDGLCDHSQSPPAGTVSTTNTTTSQNQTGQGNKTGQNQTNTTFTDIKQPNKIPKETFNLIPLSITVTILYLVTFFLYLERKIKRKLYYRIWNYVVTGSFLIAGVTGVILIVLINYGIESSWNIAIDFWHAEFAIITAITSIFHVHLYWKQFLKIFTGKEGNMD